MNEWSSRHAEQWHVGSSCLVVKTMDDFKGPDCVNM